MELFKFDTVDTDGYISQGEIINGYETLAWTERYRDPGEFELKAPVSSGLRAKLPPGTLVSHVDTEEVMYVASNEIDQDVTEGEPPLKITGRSLEYLLRHRIVGADIETYVVGGHRLYVTIQDYVIPFDSSWNQARDLINAHVNSNFNNPLDVDIPGFVAVSNQQHIGPNTVQDRSVRKQNLHSAILDILAVDDFGIRVVRPNAGNVDPLTTEFRIHNGFDLTASVRFSHALGDLDKARYLWTEEGHKTDYYCISTYYQLRSNSSAVGLDRKIMLVDCSDLDSHLNDTEAVDPVITEFLGDLMDYRGQQALRSQLPTAIVSTDISKTTKYKFREDYNVGDIVTVHGDYDVTTAMRVMEHVEFEDEQGEHGYPTLAIVYE